MSKNTRDAKFRSVDVDEYDEDKFRDDAEAAEGESNEAGQFASRESEVKKLVSTSNLTAALKAVLADPPINTKELKVSPFGQSWMVGACEKRTRVISSECFITSHCRGTPLSSAAPSTYDGTS